MSGYGSREVEKKVEKKEPLEVDVPWGFYIVMWAILLWVVIIGLDGNKIKDELKETNRILNKPVATALTSRHYNGHSYVIFEDRQGGLVHDPDCECQQRMQEEWNAFRRALGGELI